MAPKTPDCKGNALELLDKLKPLFAPVISRIGLGKDIPEQDILQPRTVESVMPPAILSKGLERITCSDAQSSLEEQFNWLTETEVEHQAVIRFHLRSVLVTDNGYFTWGNYVRYRGTDLRTLMGSEIQRTERVCCVNTGVSLRFFGHWLWDATSAALIDDDWPLFMTTPDGCYHCQDYQTAFDLVPLSGSLVHADEFVTYQDFAQGPHKAERYERLRSRLRAHFSRTATSDRVYLRRGESGMRRVIGNEDHLMEYLARDGWEIVDITEMTVPEIQQKVIDSRVVLGVEGSNMSHANFSVASGGAMVFLVPHDRVTAVHIGICRANRVNVGFCVMEGTREGGYVVDLDEVKATIDLTLQGPYQ